MAQKTEHLTTAEVSKRTGVPASTITRLIRDGQLQATKKSGKWMISQSQQNLKALEQHSASRTKAPAQAGRKKPPPAAAGTPKPAPSEAAKPAAASTSSAPPAGARNTYSVAEFSQMTYLTDFGVTEWLKAGRIRGSVDETGEWRIDGSSLELPAVKRLVR